MISTPQKIFTLNAAIAVSVALYAQPVSAASYSKSKSCTAGNVTTTAKVTYSKDKNGVYSYTGGSLTWKAAKGKTLKKSAVLNYSASYSDWNTIELDLGSGNTKKRTIALSSETLRADTSGFVVTASAGLKGDGKANCTMQFDVNPN